MKKYRNSKGGARFLNAPENIEMQLNEQTFLNTQKGLKKYGETPRKAFINLDKSILFQIDKYINEIVSELSTINSLLQSGVIEAGKRDTIPKSVSLWNSYVSYLNNILKIKDVSPGDYQLILDATRKKLDPIINKLIVNMKNSYISVDSENAVNEMQLQLSSGKLTPIITNYNKKLKPEQVNNQLDLLRNNETLNEIFNISEPEMSNLFNFTNVRPEAIASYYDEMRNIYDKIYVKKVLPNKEEVDELVTVYNTAKRFNTGALPYPSREEIERLRQRVINVGDAVAKGNLEDIYEISINEYILKNPFKFPFVRYRGFIEDVYNEIKDINVEPEITGPSDILPGEEVEAVSVPSSLTSLTESIPSEAPSITSEEIAAELEKLEEPIRKRGRPRKLKGGVLILDSDFYTRRPGESLQRFIFRQKQFLVSLIESRRLRRAELELIRELNRKLENGEPITESIVNELESPDPTGGRRRRKLKGGVLQLSENFYNREPRETDEAFRIRQRNFLNRLVNLDEEDSNDREELLEMLNEGQIITREIYDPEFGFVNFIDDVPEVGSVGFDDGSELGEEFGEWEQGRGKCQRIKGRGVLYPPTLIRGGGFGYAHYKGLSDFQNSLE